MSSNAMAGVESDVDHLRHRHLLSDRIEEINGDGAKGAGGITLKIA